jgi:hypothetical protein
MLAEQHYRHALLAQPFWARLSSADVKQRITDLLAAADTAAVVQALPPVEYLVLLKEAPDSRAALLAVAHPEQNRAVLDLDCWHKQNLRSTRLLEWLDDLRESGLESFLDTVAVLDNELLIAAFSQHVQVHAALPAEEVDEPKPYHEVLSNELYRLEFVDPDSAWNERLQRLLAFLRQADLNTYHSLMQGIMWGLQSELEEWAYRWKSGRLQDEGFPDYYDALEAYRIVDAVPFLAPGGIEPPGRPANAEESGIVPSYAWSMTPPGSLLARALSGQFSIETLERLCWEMVGLCNREFVVDQVDFADTAAIKATLQRVHAYVSLGLDYLCDLHSQPPESLLGEHSLQAIGQTGIALILGLRQRANRIQTYLNRAPGARRALPGLAQQVVSGLLQSHAQFLSELESSTLSGYRDFLRMHDVALVDGVLRDLENDLPRDAADPPGQQRSRQS